MAAKNVFANLGIRHRKPEATASTRPRGSAKSRRFRVERVGIWRPKQFSKISDDIFREKTDFKKRRSCWTLLEARDWMLKCWRSEEYVRETQGCKVWQFNHIKNLCWTRSTRSAWDLATPAQTTLPYSRIDRTFALYDIINVLVLKFEDRKPVWKDRMRSPNALLACRVMPETWDEKFNFESMITPKSLISSTESR